MSFLFLRKLIEFNFMWSGVSLRTIVKFFL